MTGEKYDYMYILNLSNYSTLPDLKEVWVSKEWQGVNDWRKSVTISCLRQAIHPQLYTSEKCGTK